MAKMKESKSQDGGIRIREQGAFSPNQITSFYNSALYVLNSGILTGRTNASVGVFSIHQLADLLHGGAYAVPINERPFWISNPKTSPYYAGADLRNLPNGGFATYLNDFFSIGGPTGLTWATEIAMDANVPHVLPKILSDEAYMRTVIFFSQQATMDLFGQASTAVTSLIDSATTGAANLLGEAPLRQNQQLTEDQLNQIIKSLPAKK